MKPLATDSVCLRTATPEDSEFLLQVYTSTREDELGMVSWWTEEQKQSFVRMQFDAQHEHYLKAYPQAEYSVIAAHDRAVGRLYLVELGTELRILDFTLLPEHQRQGVGSVLMARLIERAREKNKTLGIHVESFSPALRLLERLGFSKVAETGIYFLMQHHPSNREEAGEKEPEIASPTETGG